MESNYFKKCLVCSVENKKNDIRCKKCSGKLSDIERILVDAKELRESKPRAKKAMMLSFASPVIVFLFVILILNPILNGFGVDLSGFAAKATNDSYSGLQGGAEDDEWDDEDDEWDDEDDEWDDEDVAEEDGSSNKVVDSAVEPDSDNDSEVAADVVTTEDDDDWGDEDEDDTSLVNASINDKNSGPSKVFSIMGALIIAMFFIGAGHIYLKRYISAILYSIITPLSLGLLRQTYVDADLGVKEILLDNEVNFGVIVLLFTHLLLWLLIAYDASKGKFKLKKAPCQTACPAGIDIPNYLTLISEGRYDEAHNLIRENNPLPAVVGRVYPHPCEHACIRGIDGEPIAINPLKRFVSDFEREITKLEPILEVLPTKNETVAIIGGGPAGLSAAYYLARLGVKSTIFEKSEVAGGMLALAIPKYRLPRDVLNYEIDIIKQLGVTIKTNSHVGTEESNFKKLIESGFDAVLLAVGVQQGLKLRVEGEESIGVSDCLSFLEEANLHENKILGTKSVVIGGGNAAIDAARTLVRLGSENVTLLYRRSRKEMPANKIEVKAAEAEGVIIEFLAAPKRIIAEEGKVKEIECVKMRLGNPDSSGRRRPIPIEGSEFTIPVDTVIAAIGQTLKTDFLNYDEKLNFTQRKMVRVDDVTMMTSIDKVYSAGDCTSGPTTVINAIASGKKAALSIFYDLYKNKITWPDYKDNYIKKCEIIDIERAIKKLRIKMPALLVKDRIGCFKEVEKGYSEGMALEESLRCIKCHQELIE